MSVAVEIRQGEPRLHLWTRDEYYKMVGVGLFDGKHVELIEGKVLEMSPMGSFHAGVVGLVEDALQAVFGLGYHLRVQMPLNFGELSEPEPDIAVISGSRRDYLKGHPTTAVLIVEVAETSLDYDSAEKASLYAKAGIREYWIANLVEGELEVFRDPAPDPGKPHGFGYREVRILKRGDSVSPLDSPNSVIAIAELLP